MAGPEAVYAWFHQTMGSSVFTGDFPDVLLPSAAVR